MLNTASDRRTLRHVVYCHRRYNARVCVRSDGARQSTPGVQRTHRSYHEFPGCNPASGGHMLVSKTAIQVCTYKRPAWNLFLRSTDRLRHAFSLRGRTHVIGFQYDRSGMPRIRQSTAGVVRRNNLRRIGANTGTHNAQSRYAYEKSVYEIRGVNGNVREKYACVMNVPPHLETATTIRKKTTIDYEKSESSRNRWRP